MIDDETNALIDEVEEAMRPWWSALWRWLIGAAVSCALSYLTSFLF